MSTPESSTPAKPVGTAANPAAKSVRAPSPDLQAAASEGGERRVGPRNNAKKGTRILVIDDSTTVVFAFKKIFKSVGFVTLAALDAEAGVELARNELPDLIFLDIVLPGMNGFAALRQIRRDPLTRNIPVVMISSNEQATEQFFGSKIGADDFMKKPFARLEVFARIERLLDDDHVPRRPGSAGEHGEHGHMPHGNTATSANAASELEEAQKETALARAQAKKASEEAAQLRDALASLRKSAVKKPMP